MSQKIPENSAQGGKLVLLSPVLGTSATFCLKQLYFYFVCYFSGMFALHSHRASFPFPMKEGNIQSSSDGLLLNVRGGETKNSVFDISFLPTNLQSSPGGVVGRVGKRDLSTQGPE